MLPSRGLVRSSPFLRTKRQAVNRLMKLSSRQLGNGRQFGTLLSGIGGKRANNSPLPPTYAAAPITLGGISTSRNLSWWGGWGSQKSTPVGETVVEAAPVPVEPPVGLVVSPSIADADALAATSPVSESVVVTPPATADIDLESLINAQDILNMPEDIGYLHAIGLDYGWGFTSAMQWALEHLHVYSGLGWGGSIVATAILLRAVMLYPQIQSLRFNAVMQKMRKDPRSQEALKLIQQGFQQRDMEMRQRGQVLNKLLRQEYGASNWGIMWGFMQIPFTFGLFRIVSGMTHVPVPALESAGYLWFSDLTATDPYFLLPAAGTALMTAALAVNAKHTPPKQRKMLKTMMYVFGAVGFVGTTFLSSAVNLMTVSLGASTFITALVLNMPSIRRFLRLPPAPVESRKLVSELPRSAVAAASTTPPSASESSTSQSGISGMREQLTSSLNDMKKGFSESVSNYTGTYQGTDAERAERKRRDMLRKLEEMRKQQERDEFERKYKGKK